MSSSLFFDCPESFKECPATWGYPIEGAKALNNLKVGDKVYIWEKDKFYEATVSKEPAGNRMRKFHIEKIKGLQKTCFSIGYYPVHNTRINSIASVDGENYVSTDKNYLATYILDKYGEEVENFRLRFKLAQQKLNEVVKQF